MAGSSAQGGADTQGGDQGLGDALEATRSQIEAVAMDHADLDLFAIVDDLAGPILALRSWESHRKEHADGT